MSTNIGLDLGELDFEFNESPPEIQKKSKSPKKSTIKKKQTKNITCAEFKLNMENYGLNEKEPFIYSIINELDTQEAEKNGVSFEELIKVIDDKLGNKKTKEGIKKIFELFLDKKEDTSITLLALKKAANKY